MPFTSYDLELSIQYEGAAAQKEVVPRILDQNEESIRSLPTSPLLDNNQSCPPATYRSPPIPPKKAHLMDSAFELIRCSTLLHRHYPCR